MALLERFELIKKLDLDKAKLKSFLKVVIPAIYALTGHTLLRTVLLAWPGQCKFWLKNGRSAHFTLRTTAPWCMDNNQARCPKPPQNKEEVCS